MQGRFDLAALLAEHERDALELQDRYINPAYAAVLKTIGFDAAYARGEGAYLFDTRGRRYIDCLGGYAVFNVGRNHPVVRDALRQAMELDLPNLPGVGTFRTSGILAKKLVELAPGRSLDTVFFANSGAEAMDAALKHARIATGREAIIYCHRAYHGLTMGALSINGNPEFRDGFGPLLQNTREIPFNDLGALERALRARDAAAFVVEPIQGKGVNIPHADYLRRAKELCRAHGTLLVLDEIQTGIGRTGRMFAAEHFGAGRNPSDWEPDLLVIAKGLSGGYVPVSALLCPRSVHAKVFPSMNHCSKIQTTFGQNDLAMVAGLATLHVLEQERIVANAADVGAYLRDRLRERLSRFAMVKDVRGVGLMIAIEFGRPESAALRAGWDLLHKLDPSLFCQAVVMPLMADHRILTQVAGHRLDVIKLIPPLVLSRQDADEIVEAFEKTVSACHSFPGPAWEVSKKLGAAALRRFAPA
jgi:acetylornithine/succinyldiaminopimelate/putrescine aminotransferase